MACARVLEILAADVDRTLALIGRGRYDDVDGGVLHGPAPAAELTVG